MKDKYNFICFDNYVKRQLNCGLNTKNVKLLTDLRERNFISLSIISLTIRL